MSEKTQAKKDIKTYRDFKAWQAGHQLNQDLHIWAQEYQSGDNAQWVSEILQTARDSVVQVMEAFRKYDAPSKVRRYDAAIFYINKICYTLELGEILGWWQSQTVREQAEEYRNIVRSTLVKFIPKNDAPNSLSSSPKV